MSSTSNNVSNESRSNLGHQSPNARATDNFDLVEGLPVGVQIMAGKYGDEKCIAVAKVIEELLQQEAGVC